MEESLTFCSGEAKQLYCTLDLVTPFCQPTNIIQHDTFLLKQNSPQLGDPYPHSSRCELQPPWPWPCDGRPDTSCWDTDGARELLKPPIFGRSRPCRILCRWMRFWLMFLQNEVFVFLAFLFAWLFFRSKNCSGFVNDN